jgi:hypothetical protein
MFAAVKSFIASWGLRVAIGVGIALFALVAFLSFRLDRAQETIAAQEADIALGIAANASLVEANGELQRQAEKDGVALRDLRILHARNAADAERRRVELDRLTEENPDVQAALSAPYPIELVCLRDASNGVANADCADQGE